MRERNGTTIANDAAPHDRLRSLIARFPSPAEGALRNAPFALFLGGILAYGGLFAWYVLDRIDFFNLIDGLNTDDSFYYFKIAQYMAEGKFSTFDGGITRTNGYHPIWLFLITPFYWFFDPERALFAIKAFEIVLVAGAVVLIAAAARLARMPWYLLFAALPALYRIRSNWLGLEAAAGLFMLGLLFLALCLYARNPARWKWRLAAVAFALPWVRLEYVAISLAATAALCVIERSWRERASGASFRARARSLFALQAAAPFLAACAGILAYFAYNGLVFGGILPVSGVSKRIWSQVWWEQEGGYSLAQNFQQILQIPVFDYKLLIALAGCVCAYILLIRRLALHSRSRQDWDLLVFLAGVFGLAVGHLAKFAQTVLTVHPSQAQWYWYFVPAYLMAALVVPVGCSVAVHFIRRFVKWKPVPLANILSFAVIAAGAGFLFAITDFSEPFRYVDRTTERSRWMFGHEGYSGAMVMNRVLPEGSIVGSWDAGVVGYFSRFPVVNLDGLVNSYEYLRGYRDAGRETGWSYVDDHRNAERFFTKFGITHFANYTHADEKVDDVVYDSASFVHPNKGRMSFTVWSAAPLGDFDGAAWFWKRMAAHFDYRSEDVGLVVDGRLAQAFARDCAPGELQDGLFVFSEAAEGAKAAAAPRKNHLGFCVAAVVLPGNAAPPIRVEIAPARNVF